jgi:hypothetical protein
MSFGPKLGIILPLGSPTFRAGLYFSYLITSPTEGLVQDQPRGISSSWGIDFGLHADYLPLPWLLARLQFGLTRYASTYTPQGTFTVESASDMYVGGLLSVGYVH